MKLTRSLYDTNQAVYGLMRYGVKLKTIAGENTETIWLIDWSDPTTNHFAVAEEVTLKGEHERRPDLVLYVNGLAVGVIELKRPNGVWGSVDWLMMPPSELMIGIRLFGELTTLPAALRDRLRVGVRKAAPQHSSFLWL